MLDFALTDAGELQAMQDSPKYTVSLLILSLGYSSERYLLCMGTHLIHIERYIRHQAQTLTS